MDFFLRDGDEARLRNAQLADDMDLLYSRTHIGPWGPELVATAMRTGAHVCWYCQELFDESKSKLRPIEIRHGYSLILMHAGCIGKKPRTAQVFNDLVRGHQLRRQATRVVKASSNIESTATVALSDDIFELARQALTDVDQVDEAIETAPPVAPRIELASGIDALQGRSFDDGDNPAA